MSDEAMHDPAMEVAASVGTTLPKKRPLQLNRPGHINLAGDRGNYPGCRIVHFVGGSTAHGLEPEDHALLMKQAQEEHCSTAADLCNTYFRNRANLLSVHHYVDPGGGITMLYTNMLEGDMADDFNDFGREWELFREKRESERKEKRMKEQADKDKREAEEKALLDLGKKCRDHNLLEKLKTLDEENTKLKRELNKLKKASK